MVMVGTRAVTSVPKGTVAVMPVPLIFPVISFESPPLSVAVKTKPVISAASLSVISSSPFSPSPSSPGGSVGQAVSSSAAP